MATYGFQVCGFDRINFEVLRVGLVSAQPDEPGSVDGWVMADISVNALDIELALGVLISLDGGVDEEIANKIDTAVEKAIIGAPADYKATMIRQAIKYGNVVFRSEPPKSDQPSAEDVDALIRLATGGV